MEKNIFSRRDFLNVAGIAAAAKAGKEIYTNLKTKHRLEEVPTKLVEKMSSDLNIPQKELANFLVNLKKQGPGAEAVIFSDDGYGYKIRREKNGFTPFRIEKEPVEKNKA
jgi:hypothetical protein